jgi:hypothetical protein
MLTGDWESRQTLAATMEVHDAAEVATVGEVGDAVFGVYTGVYIPCVRLV